MTSPGNTSTQDSKKQDASKKTGQKQEPESGTRNADDRKSGNASKRKK